MECDFCKKDMGFVKKATNKLYDLRGYRVCWDCYWEDVDKDLGNIELDQSHEDADAD